MSESDRKEGRVEGMRDLARVLIRTLPKDAAVTVFEELHKLLAKELDPAERKQNPATFVATGGDYEQTT